METTARYGSPMRGGRGGEGGFRGRGRGGEHGFTGRGRGMNNFRGRGRGGENGFRGRGRGGENGFRGRGGENGFRGRGGENGFRGRGGENGFRGRGGENGFRGRGGENNFRGRKAPISINVKRRQNYHGNLLLKRGNSVIFESPNVRPIEDKTFEDLSEDQRNNSIVIRNLPPITVQDHPKFIQFIVENISRPMKQLVYHQNPKQMFAVCFVDFDPNNLHRQRRNVIGRLHGKEFMKHHLIVGTSLNHVENYVSPKCVLFKNLNSQVTEETLWSCIKKSCGPPCTFMLYPDTMEALVNFTSPAYVKKALELNGTILAGSPIEVVQLTKSNCIKIFNPQASKNDNVVKLLLKDYNPIFIKSDSKGTFAAFSDPDTYNKALALNGTTFKGASVELKPIVKTKEASSKESGSEDDEEAEVDEDGDSEEDVEGEEDEEGEAEEDSDEDVEGEVEEDSDEDVEGEVEEDSDEDVEGEVDEEEDEEGEEVGSEEGDDDLDDEEGSEEEDVEDEEGSEEEEEEESDTSIDNGPVPKLVKALNQQQASQIGLKRKGKKIDRNNKKIFKRS